MKTIEIKQTKLTSADIKGYRDHSSTEKPLDYKDIIEHTLDLPPQGGFTPSDIRDRNRIQTALDKVKEGKVKLEDADYKNLVAIINKSRWGTRDKELVTFLDLFNG